MKPNYYQLYSDMFDEKIISNLKKDLSFLKKENVSNLDIINFDQEINLHSKSHNFENQKLRSYDENSITKVLSYQKEYALTDYQTSLHFKISRNTLRKWRNYYNR
ncbi:transposase [Flavobacterium branchiophilum]|uniref:Transposase n=2 Tax=Flavobacterium branchiophilum TaxID=55197 RepID=G2Z6H8_FLABF|nr:hypothetical protein [Flavobacterium branchiophilum]PDS27032.1 transposase [Flavobacterium branchiophilum]CCB71008.1 Hypothetical protein FBFL15_3064 [Flavobacterium branchiophilum FL-15]